MTDNKGENLICESCGEELQCAGKTGACWCFEINLNPALLSELKRNYNDCLCHSCLVKKAVSAIEIEFKDC